MIENPTPRSSLETQSATDVTIRLKHLEDLHSSTSFLLQQRLSDLSEIERRLSTLEESLKRRDEALGDAVAVVAIADDEEEISDQAPEDRRELSRKSQISELAELEPYPLDGTVWGAAALVGLPGLGLRDNLSIVMGLAFNVFVQVLFCVVAYQSFTDEDLPTEQDIKRWRYTVAHDEMWSDSTGVSLVSRVCGGDAALIVSTSQVRLVQEISEYLAAMDFTLFSTEQGALLCCLAILIWLLVIMAEWHSSLSHMTVMWVLFASDKQRESTVPLTVSWYRFLAMLVIVGVRLVISSLLLAVGVHWLLITTSVEDIILNAAALGFVMELDELVYVTMLTLPVKTSLRKVDIHELGLGSCWSFDGHTSCVVWFPCFAWLTVVALSPAIVSELITNVDIMYELDHFLCAGNTGFVSRTMPSTGVIMVKESELFDTTLARTYEVKSLEEAVWIQDLDELTLPWLAPSDAWFARLQSMTTTEYANTFGTCWDLEGDGFTNPFIPLLMEDYKLDRWGCGSLSHLCSASDSSTVRMVCPETCGCDHPRSSLFLNGAAFGCPRVSCTAKDQYMVELENISCSTSNVQEHPDWTDFVVHWDAHWDESGTSDGTLKSQLLAHGCDAVQSYQAILCVETSASMGFSMWCPVQCGCRVPNGGYQDVPCPPSCDQWRSMYEESLADLPCEDAAAVDFMSGSSSSLLSVHLTVYEHAFFSVNMEDQSVSEIAIVWWLLTDYGCSALPLEYCGVPTHMRAVCPVICGCLGDASLPGCRTSCFVDIIPSTSLDTNDTQAAE